MGTRVLARASHRASVVGRLSVRADIDVETLKREIKKTYAQVSTEPEKDFIFPTGRAWAEDLDYPDELSRVPDTAVESYAGVANPFSLGRLSPGERVLDVGCGAGTDSLVAAQMVAPEGEVMGIDMTTEMLAKARARSPADRRLPPAAPGARPETSPPRATPARDGERRR